MEKFRYTGPLHFYDKKNFKYKCLMDDKRLTAGGIFFYEIVNGIRGVWLLKEDDYGTDVFTDFGGKYDFNDGDIYATIAREFREEVYNTQEIAYKDIKGIPKDHHVYINGYDQNPVYLCTPVHISKFGIKLDSEEIKKERIQILKRNTKVPQDWYKTIDIAFVPLEDIQNQKVQVSKRLRAILKKLVLHLSIYSLELQSFFSTFKF